MGSERAHYELDGQTAIVTIDNPPLNALDLPTKECIRDIFIEMDDRREEIRAVILRGGGDKAFAAGADIKAFLELDPDKAQRRLAHSHRIYSVVENFERPVIAAIHGHCLGGGLELALCCDIRYGADTAKLGFPEVNLSIFPGNGGTQRAPSLMTLGQLKELVFTGAIIDAEQALAYGLLERVVPEAELVEQALGLAHRIGKKGPLGVAAAKKVLNRTRHMALTEGLKLETDLWSGLTATEDMKEGARAFIEKRKPKYRGR
jgi:enoyl-CoA hydratase